LLSEELEPAYEILSDILLNPAFLKSETARVISDQENDIEDIIHDGSRLCLSVFQSILYHGHRYAHPIPGLRSSVRSLSAEDAESFYRSNFRSDNIIVGISGNYPADLAERVKSDFESLPSGFARQSRGNATPLSGRRAVLVEKEDCSRANIRIGNIASYSRSDPEYYPLLVANACLGQHGQSFGMLFETIRAKRGLAHEAYSYHQHLEQSPGSDLPYPLDPWNPTYHSIWITPLAVNAEFTIKCAMTEQLIITEDGIEPHYLRKVKEFIVNRFPFMYETVAGRLVLEMAQVYHGEPHYIGEYPQRVAQVTAASLAEAVGKHWIIDNYLLVAVVSDGEEFRTELLDDRTVAEYRLEESETGLDNVDESIKLYDLGLTPGDIVVVKASELFK
jgi:zinc protease